MKSPTAATPVGGYRWNQDNPGSFSPESVQAALAALNLTAEDATRSGAPIHVGFTFQFELLDCFLSPHTCNATTAAQAVRAFLNAAARDVGVPVAVTLDTYQFWYGSGLWNWFDPEQPGYDPSNTANVEWTGWTNDSATLISWRNWGSQFRMPTPQPNIASPALLNAVSSAVRAVVSVIRTWWEEQDAATRSRLVGVKICEELDVGANYYYYTDGNEFWRNGSKASDDPKHGPDWSVGLSGGLPALGYNALQTLGIRTSGNAPTRGELSRAVQNYFRAAIDAAVEAWPLLTEQEMLVAHAGLVRDPLLLEWSSPMVAPALPAYSFYTGPGKALGQPGLAEALDAYDPVQKRFVAGEFFCFACSTEDQWLEVLHSLFNTTGFGRVRYGSVYNLDAFLAKGPSAVRALKSLLREAR